MGGAKELRSSWFLTSWRCWRTPPVTDSFPPELRSAFPAEFYSLAWLKRATKAVLYYKSITPMVCAAAVHRSDL